MEEAWKKFISATQVKSVLSENAENKLITLHATDTIDYALDVLAKHSISSAPVLSSNPEHFIGTIDILDVLTLCVSKLTSDDIQTMGIARKQIDEFLQNSVQDVIDLSGRNLWTEIEVSKGLSSLIDLLKHHNVHRVAVTGQNGTILGLITQSKLIEFLYNNREQLKDKMQKKLSSFINKENKVISIDKSETVLDAMKLMWAMQVSGIAVVNSEGTLVGNISASDLKKTNLNSKGEMIADLFQPIETFLNIHEHLSPKEEASPTAKALHVHVPVFLTEEDSLEQAMQLMVTKHIHRVFIVDHNHKPIGVTTLRDIISDFQLTQSEHK